MKTLLQTVMAMEHVAGTIGAKANGEGVIGVAPGATIISLKVFDSFGGGASYQSILEAVEYATQIINDNDLPKEKCVINMSLGGPSSPAIDQAIKNIASTGVQFAIAAGNESQDADFVSQLVLAMRKCLHRIGRRQQIRHGRFLKLG